MQYGLLVIVACFFYAISNNVIKTFLQDFPTLAISSVSYFMVGVAAVGYLFYSGFIGVMRSHPHAWESLGYLAILAITGTMVASLLFFKLIKNTNALFASTVSYLIPIVAIGWGIFDGETVTAWHWLGVLAILSGVYVARK
jgi:drug/metabolite transporter (DMT)-like permease